MRIISVLLLIFSISVGSFAQSNNPGIDYFKIDTLDFYYSKLLGQKWHMASVEKYEVLLEEHDEFWETLRGLNEWENLIIENTPYRKSLNQSTLTKNKNIKSIECISVMINSKNKNKQDTQRLYKLVYDTFGNLISYSYIYSKENYKGYGITDNYFYDKNGYLINIEQSMIGIIDYKRIISWELPQKEITERDKYRFFTRKKFKLLEGEKLKEKYYYNAKGLITEIRKEYNRNFVVIQKFVYNFHN